MYPPRFLSTSACVVTILGLAVAARPANVGCPLHLGDSVQSEITPAGDTDPCVFEAAAGSTLSAVLKRGRGSDLVPGLRLFDPQGLEIGLVPHQKRSNRSVSLRNIALRETGRYRLVVFGAEGTTGSYRLKTNAKSPKASRERGIEIGPGETRDFSFCGVAGARVSLSFRMKTKGSELIVQDLLDPDGETVVGFRSFLKARKRGVSGRVDLLGCFGSYTLRLGCAQVPTTFDARLKVRFPRVASRRLVMGPDEPTISAVYATATGEPLGISGAEVTIEGANFATEGSDVWFGEVLATGEMTASATEIRVPAPSGQGIVDLSILNPDGNVGVSERAFAYAEAPRITSLDPSRGPATGGTLVTITGVDLSNVDEVQIGTAALGSSPNVVDDGTVTFHTEPHTPGSFSVHLVDAFGQVSSTSATFEFVAVPRLVWLDNRTWMAYDGNSADIDIYFAVEGDSGTVDFSVSVPETGETEGHFDEVLDGCVYLLRQHVYLGFSNATTNPHVQFDCSGSPPGPAVEMPWICPTDQILCYLPHVTLGTSTLYQLGHRLEGRWFGVVEEPDGTRHTVSFAVDARGRVDEHRHDGESTGITATVLKQGWPPCGWSGDVEYRYEDSEETVGHIRLDEEADHFTFAASDGILGVFERGAVALPSYSEEDLVGSWSGVGYGLDEDFRTSFSMGQDLVVAQDMSMTGSYESGGGFTATLTDLDATFGVFSSGWEADDGRTGSCLLIMSPDKSFCAVFALEDSVSTLPFPESHGFGGLRRQ